MISFVEVTTIDPLPIPDTPISDPLSLTLPETGVLYLYQKERSGSDTFLNLLTGKVTPKTGEIHDGETSSSSAWLGHEVSFLNEDTCPLFQSSLEDNLLFGLKKDEETKKAVEIVLTFVGLSGKKGSRLQELSEEENIRAGLATLLLRDIKTIIVPLTVLSKNIQSLLSEVSKKRLVLVLTNTLPGAETDFLEFAEGKLIHAPKGKSSGTYVPMAMKTEKPGFVFQMKAAFSSLRASTFKLISFFVLFSVSLAGLASTVSVGFYEPYQAMPDANYVFVTSSNTNIEEKRIRINNEADIRLQRIKHSESPFDVSIEPNQSLAIPGYLDGSSLQYFPISYSLKEGSLPRSDTDLMISDAYVFLMRNNAVTVYSDSGHAKVQLENGESVLGKTYGKYTICGVLDTGFKDADYAPLFSSFSEALFQSFLKNFDNTYRQVLMVNSAEYESLSTERELSFSMLSPIFSKASLIETAKLCQQEGLSCSSYPIPYSSAGTFYLLLAVSLVLFLLSLVFLVHYYVDDSYGFLSLTDRMANLGIQRSWPFAFTKLIGQALVIFALSALVSLPLTYLLNLDFAMFGTITSIVFPYSYPVFVLLAVVFLFFLFIYFFFYHKKRRPLR